ncbi:MAG TPA: sigma-70 family RNA polymerase sigma factor [Edaphocola sp.]|nr:sigma-70 family RNA polymerase sigma factor [Edaphocola sp.]
MPQSTYRNLLDEELLYKVVQRKDQEAMNLLYKRYAHLCLGISIKYLPLEDAKDATQQVFLKIWQDAEKHKIKFFKPWLYTVVRNQCLMQLRKSNPSIVSLKNEIDFVEYEDNSHHNMEQETILMKLEACLENLETSQREAIELFYKGQKTYSEIAVIQNADEKSIKSYLQNGRRNLKICFGKSKI